MCAPTPPAPPVCGWQVTGTTTAVEDYLGEPGGDVFFKFALLMRGVYHLAVSRSTAFPVTLRLFSFPSANVINPAATPIRSCADCSNYPIRAELVAGEYLLVVEGASGTHGDFSVDFSASPGSHSSVPCDAPEPLMISRSIVQPQTRPEFRSATLLGGGMELGFASGGALEDSVISHFSTFAGVGLMQGCDAISISQDRTAAEAGGLLFFSDQNIIHGAQQSLQFANTHHCALSLYAVDGDPGYWSVPNDRPTLLSSSFDPRPGYSSRLCSVIPPNANDDNFFSPSPCRGAFMPGDSWLAGWSWLAVTGNLFTDNLAPQAPPPSPPCSPGDIDLSGAIDENDVFAYNLAIIGLGPPIPSWQIACADLNGDGLLAADDVLWLTRYLAGWGAPYTLTAGPSSGRRALQSTDSPPATAYLVSSGGSTNLFVQLPTCERFNAAVLHFDQLEMTLPFTESVTLSAPMSENMTHVNLNDRIVSFIAFRGDEAFSSGLHATFVSTQAALQTVGSRSYLQHLDMAGAT